MEQQYEIGFKNGDKIRININGEHVTDAMVTQLNQNFTAPLSWYIAPDLIINISEVQYFAPTKALREAP